MVTAITSKVNGARNKAFEISCGVSEKVGKARSKVYNILNKEVKGSGDGGYGLPVKILMVLVGLVFLAAVVVIATTGWAAVREKFNEVIGAIQGVGTGGGGNITVQ